MWTTGRAPLPGKGSRRREARFKVSKVQDVRATAVRFLRITLLDRVASGPGPASTKGRELWDLAGSRSRSWN